MRSLIAARRSSSALTMRAAMAARSLAYGSRAGGSRFTAQREAEWAEFTADCGKYEAELDGKVAKGRLALVELDKEEQSLERLRR